MFCKECGSEISDSVKFCPNCGKPIIVEAAVETVEEVTEAVEEAAETVAQVAVEAVEEAASEATSEIVSESKVNNCPKCGAIIPAENKFCPKCGSLVGATQVTPVSPVVYTGIVEPTNESDSLVTVLGILSVIIGLLGTILFGIFGAIIGLALGIVALVMSIDIKKRTNNAKGGAGFTLGIIGVCISALLSISCVFCGSCTCGYGCYGCVGGACKTGCAACRTERAIENFADILDDYS